MKALVVRLTARLVLFAQPINRKPNKMKEELEKLITNAETTQNWSDKQCFEFTEQLYAFIEGLYLFEKEELIRIIQSACYSDE
jgi:predicted AAA+ superfamily ATPase